MSDAPTCPIGHGPMVLRPIGQQTPEQRWCGTWWDCESCRSSVLIPSPELAAQMKENPR